MAAGLFGKRRRTQTKYVHFNNLTLSSFALGTVQLGLKYGLGEHSDKPTEETAFAILDKAIESGVNTLDTANNYGDSETVIGHWLKKQKESKKPQPWVVTKISLFDHSSYDSLRDSVRHQLDGCLSRLNMDKLDCLMLHNYEDYARDPDAIQKIFAELKAEGLYDYSAISAYSHHDYSKIADSGFDAVQIPLNVFDWGQIENDGLQKLADANMMIFARSVFLQGLVFHTPEDLDPRMEFCFPCLRRYIALCNEFELSPAELALSFVLSIPGITQVVMGCDTIQQVAENCSLFNRATQLNAEQIEALRSSFRDIDPRIINPGKWYNKM